MRFFISSSVLCIMMLFGASRGAAITFSDLDVINKKLTANSSNPANRSYQGTFNIIDDGFIPGYHQVGVAGIIFSLADDQDRETETFAINLDGLYSTVRYTAFLLLGVTEVGVDLLASLNADGILNYSVKATTGDFWLKSALLIADARVVQPTEPGTQPVPENGSTLILMAVGLVGLGVVGRRTLRRC